MIKKYAVLGCLLFSVALLLVAASLYPGGSLLNRNSEGFGWSTNFISNLFNPKAMNGLDNPGRIWAVIGMAFHAMGYAIFFVRTAQKIPNKHATLVLQCVGYGNVLFDFLIATPLHDVMITVSSTFSLLGLFYITVFLFKTRLQLLKVFAVLCLLLFYFTLYIYGTGQVALLAILQKVAALAFMVLALWIEYNTTAKDFVPAAVTANQQTI